MKLNNKGMLLLSTYFIIALLLFFIGMFAFKNLWEARAVERYKQNIQSFNAAEAGMDAAIAQLPNSTAPLTNVALVDHTGQSRATYSATISVLQIGKKWRVDSWGYVPNAGAAVVSNHLQSVVEKTGVPPSFWGNAIYTAGNVVVNGNAYSIQGDVIYAGTSSALTPPNFMGTSTPDPSINPLARLDFSSLRAIAQTQIKAGGVDNLYTAAEIATGNPPLPKTFWYDTSNPDPTKWIPNVVYVESDLILNGKITIGGFLVVVGDILNTPDETDETIINGTGQIDGCVYSTGQFRVNGGGQGLNVLGGVWSGGDGVRLNGSITVQYNAAYMNAIRDNLPPPGSSVKLRSWREVNS